MTYRVEFERTAEKEFLKLPPLVRARVAAALETLAEDPFVAKNVKALKGGGYRLRVGGFNPIAHARAARP